MSRLSSNHNVYQTCLRIIRSKGFDVSIYREDQNTEIQDCLWVAEKGGFEFLAENPIELLGLATIYETVVPETDKPYWWRIDGEDVYNELFDKAFPETPEDE